MSMHDAILALAHSKHKYLTVRQIGLMLALHRHEPMGTAQLGAYLRMGKPAVTRVCTSLARAGLLRRDVSVDDKRLRSIWLTEDGVKLAAQLAAVEVKPKITRAA